MLVRTVVGGRNPERGRVQQRVNRAICLKPFPLSSCHYSLFKEAKAGRIYSTLCEYHRKKQTLAKGQLQKQTVRKHLSMCPLPALLWPPVVVPVTYFSVFRAWSSLREEWHVKEQDSNASQTFNILRFCIKPSCC